MSLIKTVFGSHIGQFYNHPYWAVKLRDPERWISEIDGQVNFLGAIYKPYDWTMDLISTGDIFDIEELWMFCPKTDIAPQGSTCTLRFTTQDKGTAFQFNVTKMKLDTRVDHKIIGKVIDRASGDCECFIWDDEMRVMSMPYYTNVNKFKSWREGIAPIGQLSHAIIGLRL